MNQTDHAEQTRRSIAGYEARTRPAVTNPRRWSKPRKRKTDPRQSLFNFEGNSEEREDR